ncbi:unnamed protein product [Caenorhabditis angaria]|uniref:Uncharacterized protein n=1 Tax=Caenorhabditis angaria TaxID=860376 RepID=A0A9P1N4X7_9PELO|nr:unnamed protein product [Caenorhabditis angaria]
MRAFSILVLGFLAIGCFSIKHNDELADRFADIMADAAAYQAKYPTPTIVENGVFQRSYMSDKMKRQIIRDKLKANPQILSDLQNYFK